jgi:hypothetical protein
MKPMMNRTNIRRSILSPRRPSYFEPKQMWLYLVCVLILARTVAAETPLYTYPISRADAREIERVIRAVTAKRILFIATVVEDKFVPGAVKGDGYQENLTTGERKQEYIRTDLVSVYMRYTDSSHVDVYTVRKVRGRWKIESKKDWFI